MRHDRPVDAPATAGPAQEGTGPAFAQPWQARAFALAVLASRKECFTWSEWTRALSDELQRAPDKGYFDCWLSALQSLLLGKGAVMPRELDERKHAWEDAFHRTPHGAPVQLADQ